MGRKLLLTGIICIVVSVAICKWLCVINPPIVTKPTDTEGTDCTCPKHVEVEVSSGCSPVYPGGASADPLDVDEGDIVIFTNKNANTAEISFTSASPFSTDFIRIEPGAQYVAVVRDDAGGSPPVDYSYSLVCGGGTVTNPKVNVSGGGGG